jgi:hypothetical protein
MILVTTGKSLYRKHLGPPRRLTPGDPTMGREKVLTHKSGRRRAYAQWIVTTRLLYHLHDPAELNKSYAKDLSPRIVKLPYVS